MDLYTYLAIALVVLYVELTTAKTKVTENKFGAVCCSLGWIVYLPFVLAIVLWCYPRGEEDEDRKRTVETWLYKGRWLPLEDASDYPADQWVKVRGHKDEPFEEEYAVWSEPHGCWQNIDGEPTEWRDLTPHEISTMDHVRLFPEDEDDD